MAVYEEAMQRIAVQYKRAEDRLAGFQFVLDTLEDGTDANYAIEIVQRRNALHYRMEGLVIAFKCFAMAHGMYTPEDGSPEPSSSDIEGLVDGLRPHMRWLLSRAGIDELAERSLNEHLDALPVYVPRETMEEVTVEIANMLVNYSVNRSSEYPAGLRHDYGTWTYPDMIDRDPR